VSKRRLYLNNEPWENALENFMNKLRQSNILMPGSSQVIDVSEALGRVTAEPVYANISSPHYPAAAMDGIAVQAKSTYGASETNPVQLILGKDALEVDTGDPLPEGFNGVIMAEDIHYLSDQEVEIIQAAAPWQHVRPIGEDLVATEMILPSNHLIRPYDIGGCLAGAASKITVHPRPKVALIPTGTELVEPTSKVEPGDIIEYNSKVLGALVKEWGGQAIYYQHIPDDYQALKEGLLKAAQEGDIVVVIAGSSAGREDYTNALISELGELYTHGLAIKPGKPALLGIINNKPVVGVPGYPVSAVIVFELLVQPLIYAKLQLIPPERLQVGATLSRKLPSTMGMEEFVRVTLGQVGEKLMATPVSRGAGVITSLIRADGIMRIPRLAEGYAAGEKVQVELLKPLETIKRTLVAIGSHDLAVDILNDHLKQEFPGFGISSANVGSLGGLMALKRGEAHLAGTHLLDENTGEYNISYVTRYLPELEVVLVNLVYREQGLMVLPGNPKGITSIKDLARDNIEFMNRQAGSGTRVLFDYLLKKAGITPEEILGYQREEYTHLAVAAAVNSGTADVAMGILSAAKAFGLDFIPITKERYDLCIPKSLWESSLCDKLREILASIDFHQDVESKGGYDLSDCGKVLWSSS
jgi:putative molybdopterin biosynthesis protein